MKVEWIYCPYCNCKTKNKMRDDTFVKNFPLYCSKCKRECLVNVENLKITVIKEPVA